MFLRSLLLPLLLIATIAGAQTNYLTRAKNIASYEREPVDQLNQYRLVSDAYLQIGDTSSSLSVYRESIKIVGSMKDSMQKAVNGYTTLNHYKEIVPKQELINDLEKIAPSFQLLPTHIQHDALTMAMLEHYKINSVDGLLFYLDKIKGENWSSGDYKCNAMVDLRNKMLMDLYESKNKTQDLSRFRQLWGMIPDHTVDLPYSRGKNAPCVNRIETILTAALVAEEIDTAAKLIQLFPNIINESWEFKEGLSTMIDSGRIDQVWKVLRTADNYGDNYEVQMYLLEQMVERDYDPLSIFALKDHMTKRAEENPKDKEGRGNDKFNRLITCLLELKDWDRAERVLNLIESNRALARAYTNFAFALREEGKQKEALKYLDKGYSALKKVEPDSFVRNYFTEMAIAYKVLKAEKKGLEVLEAAEKMSRKIKSKTFVEYSLEDVAITYARFGEYEKAWALAGELSNDGSGSRRSSCEEKIYKVAFSRKNLDKAMKLLEQATLEVENIGHQYQRQWYRREAAIQYAKESRYNRALEIAAELETNTFGYVQEFIEGFVAAHEENEEKPVGLQYYPHLLKVVKNAGGGRKTAPLKMLIDQLVEDHGTEIKWDFEEAVMEAYNEKLQSSKKFHPEIEYYLHSKMGNSSELTKMLKEDELAIKTLKKEKKLKKLIDLELKKQEYGISGE